MKASTNDVPEDLLRKRLKLPVKRPGVLSQNRKNRAPEEEREKKEKGRGPFN